MSKFAIGVLIATIGGTLAAILGTYYLHLFGPKSTSTQALSSKTQTETANLLEESSSNTLHKSIFDLMEKINEIKNDLRRSDIAENYLGFKVSDHGYFIEMIDKEEGFVAEIQEIYLRGGNSLKPTVHCDFDKSWKEQLHLHEGGEIIFSGVIDKHRAHGPWNDSYLSECNFRPNK